MKIQYVKTQDCFVFLVCVCVCLLVLWGGEEGVGRDWRYIQNIVTFVMFLSLFKSSNYKNDND